MLMETTPMSLKKRIQSVLEEDHMTAHAVNSRYIKTRANGDAGMIVVFTENEHTICHDPNVAMGLHRFVVDMGTNYRDDMGVVIMTMLATAARIRGPPGASASRALLNPNTKKHSTNVVDVGLCIWVVSRESMIYEKIVSWGAKRLDSE
eukprot:6386490-Amphidinium_carterae.1